MAKERTLVIVKPDGVQRGLVGPILSRLEARGLKIVGLKLVQVSQELAARHYAEHEGKPFYPGLLKYITSAPVIVACVEGTSAVQMVGGGAAPPKPDCHGRADQDACQHPQTHACPEYLRSPDVVAVRHACVHCLASPG